VEGGVGLVQLGMVGERLALSCVVVKVGAQLEFPWGCCGQTHGHCHTSYLCRVCTPFSPMTVSPLGFLTPDLFLAVLPVCGMMPHLPEADTSCDLSRTSQQGTTMPPVCHAPFQVRMPILPTHVAHSGDLAMLTSVSLNTT
jgi:hypothetical protein